MIERFLQEHYESDLIVYLKAVYQNKTSLSAADLLELKEYETEDYALLGIIGLILNSKPRILIGMKQPFDQDISGWCKQFPVILEELEVIADKYLEDDFSEENEAILRIVMHEYPRSYFDS